MEERYLEDASGFKGHADRLIVPADEAELAAALREASASKTQVTISGAGTGVTGGRVPFGGWVISLERFKKLEIHEGYAIAGAGVLLGDVHAAAQSSGQFYPPDPTETSSSIGGNIATNASGSRSFKYGATRRWIDGLRCVFSDGTIREFRRGEPIDFDPGTIPLPQVTKNTAGYLLKPGMDWVDLIVGAEGTLAVVTEARLKLLPAPKAVLGGVVFFESDDACVDAVEKWRETASPRMLEYFDAPSLTMLKTKFPEIPPKAKAAVLFEQELESEDDPEVDAWAERVEQATALGEQSWFALTAADRERFRKFRHTLPELVNETVRRNGCIKMNTDFAAPLSKNREMLNYYRRRLEAEYQGRYVIFGHIGDAHVHVNVLSGDAKPLLEEFAQEAVRQGGTVSAEHGLGKRKAHYLKWQYSEADLEKMRAVKRRLDPAGILGQGVGVAAA